jgi:alpha-L-fucosidase
MKNNFLSYYILISLIIFQSCLKVSEPEPVLPIPTTTQIAWSEMERNAFIHFGLNTFNDMEWGYGDTPEATFNPSSLDVDQWCRIIKAAGLKGIILTTKHHDGFCLWPTETTTYSVKNSPWKDGKGDLVRDLSDACKTHGLKFGIYLSPWDRNSATYGTEEYIDMFRTQLTELLTNYDDIFEVWFDGANGGSGYYGGANENRSVDRKTYYDWPETIKLVRKLQPNALIFSDAGPDIRWCGNERGQAGRTNWSTLRRDEVWPGWPRYHELTQGHEDGDYWVPAEINTSIRPGWFYHESEDHQVKSLASLMDYFYESVGRNGVALLNFPIDKRGLIHDTDSANIVMWHHTIQKELNENILPNAKKISASETRGNSRKYSVENVRDNEKNTSWSTDDGTTNAYLIIEFGDEISFNRFLIQEDIALGQRVKSFSLEVEKNGIWAEVACETTIGYKRILRLPDITTNKIRVNISDAKASPVISNIEIYNAPQLLTNPKITRNQKGEISISSHNKNLQIYFTLDGSEPGIDAQIYHSPIPSKGHQRVRAVSYDPLTGNSSSITDVSFDIERSKWLVLTNDTLSAKILDGNIHSAWYLPNKNHPADLTIDLGEVLHLKGFKYIPDQSRWGGGIIFKYKFFTSVDGENWELASDGEFSNIQNHPVWQEKRFPLISAQYIKLVAINNTAGDGKTGIAELDVITE